MDELRGLPCPCCASPNDARKPGGTLPAGIGLGDKQPAGLLLFNPCLSSRLSPAGDEISSSSDGISSSSSNSSCCILSGGNSSSFSTTTVADGNEADSTSSSSSIIGDSGMSGNSSIEALPWICSSCGVRLPDNDAVLLQCSVAGMEEAVCQAVYAMDQQMDANPSADLQGVTKLVAFAGMTLGANHWALHYALMLHTGEPAFGKQPLVKLRAARTNLHAYKVAVVQPTGGIFSSIASVGNRDSVSERCGTYSE